MIVSLTAHCRTATMMRNDSILSCMIVGGLKMKDRGNFPCAFECRTRRSFIVRIQIYCRLLIRPIRMGFIAVLGLTTLCLHSASALFTRGSLPSDTAEIFLTKPESSGGWQQVCQVFLTRQNFREANKPVYVGPNIEEECIFPYLSARNCAFEQPEPSNGC